MEQLRTQFQLLEEDFERMAIENAISPPDHVKVQLQTKLNKSQEKSKKEFGFMQRLVSLFYFL